MVNLYLMNLEDRVELARSQLDRVILRLRSVNGQSPAEEIERTVDLATSQLQQISELIGR